MIPRLVQSFTTLIAILAADIGSAEVPAASPASPRQRVLVLYSDERLLPANVIIDEAIRTTFAASIGNQVEFYSEFLDRTRFPGDTQEIHQRDFLRDKYLERPPSLVIAVSGAALTFLMNNRDELFVRTPLVYCSVASDPRPKNLKDPTLAEVPVFSGALPTLEMALRLHPDTRQIAVVVGSGPRDRQFADAFREEIHSVPNRIPLTWLTNLSMDQLRNELSRLPDHTVVLYLVMFQDAAGQMFTPRQALDQFAPASRAPIYGHYDTFLGHGIVGGTMVTFEQIGRKTAQLGMRILAGEDPLTAARSETYQPAPMFDWHQLRKWKISERLLPPGSLVRNRELTAWEQHRGTILATAGLCTVETFLIAFLLWQLRRRRLAEASLHSSEQRMTLAVDAAKFGIWVRDLARNEIWASDQWRVLFGFGKTERLELPRVLERVHPEDREPLSQTFANALEHGGDYETQYRVVLPGEQVRWISSHGRVDRNGSGKPVLLLGVSRDITVRKLAESEIQQQRAELLHVARVSTMGLLASSLAHELNQPLGAILRNAEAAELFLQNGDADIDEVRAILADIRQDDQRAGAVIDRMRSLLKHREFQGSLLNMNTLVSEVILLVRSDAESRRIKVVCKPAFPVPPVWGDRIQLQQVVLNLLLNAMDAMSDCSPESRCAYVSVTLVAAQVEVAVSDTGHGIPEKDLARLFVPFFTTKPTGLGMGLAISQTIIAAHKGSLTAENNASGGATFRMILPVAEPSESAV